MSVSRPWNTTFDKSRSDVEYWLIIMWFGDESKSTSTQTRTSAGEPRDKHCDPMTAADMMDLNKRIIAHEML